MDLEPSASRPFIETINLGPKISPKTNISSPTKETSTDEEIRVVIGRKEKLEDHAKRRGSAARAAHNAKRTIGVDGWRRQIRM